MVNILLVDRPESAEGDCEPVWNLRRLFHFLPFLLDEHRSGDHAAGDRKDQHHRQDQPNIDRQGKRGDHLDVSATHLPKGKQAEKDDQERKGYADLPGDIRPQFPAHRPPHQGCGEGDGDIEKVGDRPAFDVGVAGHKQQDRQYGWSGKKDEIPVHGYGD